MNHTATDYQLLRTYVSLSNKDVTVLNKVVSFLASLHNRIVWLVHK